MDRSILGHGLPTWRVQSVRTRITQILAGNTLKARATRGSFFTIINFGGQNVIRLASNLILTRLLFPEAFGLMALVQVCMTGMKLFSDVGVREAAVQSKDGDSSEFLNTAWVINIVRGFILWFATLLLAAPMAEFYDAPLLAELLPVVGLTMVFGGFASPRILFADRNLILGRLTALILGSQVVGVLVMVILAWWLESVWALAIGWVFQALLTSVLSHIVLPGERSRFAFNPAIGLRIFGFGKYIFLSTVAAFVIAQADRAVLGKFVSLDNLAIYNIGLMLAMVPMNLSKALASRVLFPVYARRPPSESAEARRKINMARRVLTGGVLFGSAVLAFIGIGLVEFLYDERYEAAGPFVALISLAMIPTIIISSYVRLALAAGHSGRFAILTIALALVQLSALILGIQNYGMGGLAVAPGVAALAFYPLLIASIRRYQGWDPLHDAGYFLVGIGIVGCVLWLNGDAIWPLFKPL